jgi:hypothetical protein
MFINGAKHELEHLEDVGGNYEIICKIALSHLKEFPIYYVNLEKMENEMREDMERGSMVVLKNKKFIVKTIRSHSVGNILDFQDSNDILLYKKKDLLKTIKSFVDLKSDSKDVKKSIELLKSAIIN